MRISDVKVGDVVVPLPWFGDYDTVGELGRRERICHGLRKVTSVDRSDSTVELDCSVDGMGRIWWPIRYCDPTPHTVSVPNSETKADQPNASQLLQHLHEREKAELRRDRDRAVKEAEAAERALTAARSEAASEIKALRSQLQQLEKQVANLKAERDRVGKTSQSGTRFAQLELD